MIITQPPLFLAKATVDSAANSSNILPEVVSTGDFEGSIYDIAMNMPTISSSRDTNVTSDEDGDGWVHVLLKVAPIVSVVVYTFAYGAGFGPAIYCWTSEVFQSNTKAIGSSISLSR